MNKTLVFSLAIGLIAAAALSTAAAPAYDGTLRIGATIVDEEGSRGVNQPTYNLYEGVGLSLENFQYRLDNGLRFDASLKNVTMNNRNLNLGLSRSGLFGVSMHNDQYRRTYSFSGDRFTRRSRTSGNAWFKPHEYIKVYGGLGTVDKHGDMVELFDPAGFNSVNAVDYTHTYYHAGLALGHDRDRVTVEYRGSEFTDNLAGSMNDRSSRRFRVVASTVIPRLRNLALNGGFQHYENRLELREDTLTANTVWGGARYFHRGGWSLRYSFIWDRARRTGDLAATDNISHAVFGDKVWRGNAGLTVGYRYKINDDVLDELQTDSYLISGWLRPSAAMTLRAGYGTETSEVQSGATLTGNRDFTRAWGSIRYRYDYGTIRLKVEDKSIENDDIGSTADYVKVATDMSVDYARYGTLTAGYSYYNGKYDNTDGGFRFEEHVVSGDFMSSTYHGLQAGIGGSYMRSRLDVDVESSTLRFKGVYTFAPTYQVEAVYSAHNFDDFGDLSGIYSRYYTANVVEINLLKDF